MTSKRVLWSKGSRPFDFQANGIDDQAEVWIISLHNQVITYRADDHLDRNWTGRKIRWNAGTPIPKMSLKICSQREDLMYTHPHFLYLIQVNIYFLTVTDLHGKRNTCSAAEKQVELKANWINSDTRTYNAREGWKLLYSEHNWNLDCLSCTLGTSVGISEALFLFFFISIEAVIRIWSLRK